MLMEMIILIQLPVLLRKNKKQTKKEATIVIQVGDDGCLDRGGTEGGRSDGFWM